MSSDRPTHDSYNLSDFGWDNTFIPTNLTNICKYLPNWHKLKVLRHPQLMGNHQVYFPYSYFHDISGNPYLPALEKGILYNTNGGYAYIYRGKRAIYEPIDDKFGNVSLIRTQDFKEICVKEILFNVSPDEGLKGYEDEMNAILYEAYLHALLYKTLESYEWGLESYIPKLHDIVGTTRTFENAFKISDFDSIWMTMEFLEGTTLEKYLNIKFNEGTKEQNSKLLVDVLIQLCNLLYILQNRLNFNHRDLKINNVYVRAASSEFRRNLLLPYHGYYECQTDIVMIDFGFSCVACGSGFLNPRATMIGAGSFFKTDDDCMKAGRDMAQFLYSLQCCFSLQNYITMELFDVLHNSVMADTKDKKYDLWMGVDIVGNPLTYTTLPNSLKYNNGIYIFLRQNDIQIPNCDPLILLKNIWPHRH
jgi:serine/threonine protein kinase